MLVGGIRGKNGLMSRSKGDAYSICLMLQWDWSWTDCLDYHTLPAAYSGQSIPGSKIMARPFYIPLFSVRSKNDLTGWFNLIP